MQTVNKETVKRVNEAIEELGRTNPDSSFSLVAEVRRRGLFNKEYKDRGGGEYLVCCPFHNDEDPSMSVRESTQSFYCYGCEARGGLVSFLTHWENDVEARKTNYYSVMEKLLKGSEILQSKSKARSIYQSNFMQDERFSFRKRKIDGSNRVSSPQEIAQGLKGSSDDEKLDAIAKLQCAIDGQGVESVSSALRTAEQRQETERMEIYSLMDILSK